MNPQASQIAGSPVWQLVFVSFAILLVLFEVLRGWRRGVARQLARLGALIAAYFAAFFCGRFVAPMAKPFLHLPDAILSILAGAALALIVYAVINGLGTVLFRRTRQYHSIFGRLFCGAGGAALGLFFGLFLVWLLVVCIRSVGAVAIAEFREQAATDPSTLHAVDVRLRYLGEPPEEQTPFVASLARLKNSLEMGVIGHAVEKSDVIPAKTYQILEKVGQVASSPQNAERFLQYPGAHDLSEHPKIVALRSDQDISDMLAEGRFLDLVQDSRIIDAANDPELRQELKKFDLNAALDFALQKQQ
jgi:uncharacterized membrane protein required for colicin V production